MYRPIGRRCPSFLEPRSATLHFGPPAECFIDSDAFHPMPFFWHTVSPGLKLEGPGMISTNTLPCARKKRDGQEGEDSEEEEGSPPGPLLGDRGSRIFNRRSNDWGRKDPNHHPGLQLTEYNVLCRGA